MAGRDPKEIPDLVVPPPRVRTSAPRPPETRDPFSRVDDGIDRGSEMEQIAALVSAPASVSSRATSEPGSGPRIEIDASPSYRERYAPQAAAGPAFSSAERGAAWGLPIAIAASSAGVLLKFAHHAGRSPLALFPHAFDASSVAQSGAIAALALVLAITVGAIGFRLEPRSRTLIAAAVPLLLTSLAMVTVALVATDEHPGPPDGARLVPYVLPLGVLLVAMAWLTRAPAKYLEGERLKSLVFGLAAGLFVFVAFELSALAR